MKKKLIFISVLGMALSTMLFSGCANSGLLASANITTVELSKGNYKIVATSISGQASAQYILGASLGMGIYLQTFALIPLTPDRQLYKIAMQDLWKNFETKYGSPVGRKLALVNIRYDSEALNLLVFTEPRVTIIADVIEFTD
jgi:hypothetical protein